MLAGLSGDIAPSLVRSVFHLDSGLLNGSPVSWRRGLRRHRPPFARVDSRRAIRSASTGHRRSIVIIGGVLARSLAT